MKIYLVDDDSDEADLFRDAVEIIDSSIELVCFDDVMKALDALMKEQTLPDIIFLDINIPQVSGKELLKILRGNPTTEKLRVVVYSTTILKKDIEDTSALRVTSYLQKPETFEMLCDKIREFLGEGHVN